MRISDTYFTTMAEMQAAVSTRDYEHAARLVRNNILQIPRWVKETCLECGSFDIRSIPAFEQGGIVLALVGDDEGLAEMQQIVASTPELAPWRVEVDRHKHDRNLFESILDVVRENPSCLQTDIKDLVGEEDGRRVANLVSYLEKARKITRVKTGRTYRLVLPGSPEVPAAPPQRIARSHRADRTSPRLREIDISSLTYVPLPRSPPKWEEARARRERSKVSDGGNHFEIQDADWQIVSIDKIPSGERPDPAFRKVHATDSGVLMIDDLGNADGLGQIEGAALRYDRTGKIVAKAGLRHGVYRTGVHPLGHGLIAMS